MGDWEELHSGELYFPGKEEILREQAACLEKLYAFNATRPCESEQRERLLSDMFAQIGEGCYIGAGAKIIGGITVGHHCRIGANAVVYEDMPPYSVAVCAPTRVLQKDGLDNTFRTVIDGEPYLSRDGRLVRDTAPGEGKVPAGVE